MKNQKGITLVALIVTIIVLIILAGISINLLLGDNGIITKAKEGKKLQIINEAKEKIATEIMTAQIEATERGEKIEQSQISDIISNYGELQADGDTIILKDSNEKISLSDIYKGDITNKGSYSELKAQNELLKQQLEDASKSQSEASKELNELKETLAQTTATESQILKDYTAYKDGKLITGAMENKGELNWNPASSITYTVPAGYYSGGTLDSSGAYTAGYTDGFAEGKISSSIDDVWRSNTNSNTFSFSYTAPTNGSLSCNITFSGNSHEYIANPSGQAYFWVKKNSTVILGSTSNIINTWWTDTYEGHIGYSTISWNKKISLEKGDVVEFYGYCTTRGKVDFNNNYGQHNLLQVAGSIQFIY